MTATQSNKKGTALTGFVREQVQAVQGHLQEFQKEAEKMIDELAEKGREPLKELDRLVARLEKSGWAEKPGELAGKAMDFGAELASHLEELQTKAVKFVGVASQTEVELLAKEMRKLAAKVEALAKGPKKRRGVGQA